MRKNIGLYIYRFPPYVFLSVLQFLRPPSPTLLLVNFPSICVSCMQTFLPLVMDPKACKGGHFPPTSIELRLMVGWNVSPSQARQNPSKDSLDLGGGRASPSVELVAVNKAHTACSLVIGSALPLQGTVVKADLIRSLVVRFDETSL